MSVLLDRDENKDEKELAEPLLTENSIQNNDEGGNCENYIKGTALYWTKQLFATMKVLLHVVRMLYLLVVDHKPFITAGLLELLGLFVWGLYLVAETQQFRNTKISHSHLGMSLVVLVVLSVQTLQLTWDWPLSVNRIHSYVAWDMAFVVTILGIELLAPLKKLPISSLPMCLQSGGLASGLF